MLVRGVGLRFILVRSVGLGFTPVRGVGLGLTLVSTVMTGFTVVWHDLLGSLLSIKSKYRGREALYNPCNPSHEREWLSDSNTSSLQDIGIYSNSETVGKLKCSY